MEAKLMVRRLSFALAALIPCSLAYADPSKWPTSAFDDEIARHAAVHGVPTSLVHRVVMRESRYQPHLVHNRCFGLMQIKHATARGMGYKGEAKGLLDPHVNLTYAIPYLANAYHVADGDENRAVALFAGGYYYAAKRKNMLAELRTASSTPLVAPAPEPAPAPQPVPRQDLISSLVFLLSGSVDTSLPTGSVQ
jgi:soluble lytic murein transglycosylase-like protein